MHDREGRVCWIGGDSSGSFDADVKVPISLANDDFAVLRNVGYR